MSRDDLQIGDTWTSPDARGAGLAGLAIQEAMSVLGKAGRRFWYIVDEGNSASVRAIEKQGFSVNGHGARVPRLGIGALGYYALDAKSSENSELVSNNSRS
jgi:RimJ/RimL family protein N-acetyltransferase